jgi:predicted protein tyrosine phosphatase
MNLLFVCQGNLERSPSFAKWFRENRTHEVKSCGTSGMSPCRINTDLLYWADKVFVMDLEQEIYINTNYPWLMYKVEVIGISDDYHMGSPLIDRLISYWTGKKGL